MSARLIMLVEDEQAISDMIGYSLRRAGFETLVAPDCRAARALLTDRRPELVLMDWMLPDGSGLELTRELKRETTTRDLPVIMLTARAAESDKVTGLDGGADDYITKPFSTRELVARVNALLRRSSADEGSGVLQAGELLLNRSSHRVTVGGRELELGPTVYRLLEFLMLHPDRVFSRTQLLDRVWGGGVYVEDRTVDVHVRRLRLALQPSASAEYVQTVRGSGYRFSMTQGR